MHACWDGGMESAQTQGAHINSTGQGTYKGGCRHAWQAMVGGRSRAMHAPADRGAKNLTSNDWPSSSMLESRAACRWQQNAPSTGRQSAVHTQDGKDGGGFGEVAAQRGAGWMPPHRTHPAPPPPSTAPTYLRPAISCKGVEFGACQQRSAPSCAARRLAAATTAAGGGRYRCQSRFAAVARGPVGGIARADGLRLQQVLLGDGHHGVLQRGGGGSKEEAVSCSEAICRFGRRRRCLLPAVP